MSKLMKAFYTVVTQNNKWGKSLSLKEALKLAGVTNCKTVGFIVYIGVCKPETTQEQLSNISRCFNVNDWGGLSLYSDPSQEDLDMVNEYLLNWISNEDYIIKK